jgi:hypothetical protein
MIKLLHFSSTQSPIASAQSAGLDLSHIKTATSVSISLPHLCPESGEYMFYYI